MIKCRTICDEVTVEGIGLHTGKPARVTLYPFPPGGGIWFVSNGVEIAARVENVVDTMRCTVLGDKGVRVSTVEHLLSACAGLGITDLTVHIDGPELPIGDGSAQIWVDALSSVLAEDVAPTPKIVIQMLDLSVLCEPILVSGKNGAFIAMYPSDTLRVTVCASFEHPLVGTQIARYAPGENGAADYTKAIAPARTFGFIEEVEALRQAGLALGGSLDNAVVVYPDRYSQPLRFSDELARHKLLDVLGDLNLAFGGAGVPIADIIAVKPSHTLNTEAARRIAAQTGFGASLPGD